MFNCKRTAEKITLSGDDHARQMQIILRCRRGVGKITNGKLLRELPEGQLMEWTDTAKPLTMNVTD